LDALHVALLGAIAGFTIFLGLPVARIRSISPRTRGFLSVVSAGVLLFIFWDVMSAVHEIVEAALEEARSAGGDWSGFVVRLAMVIAGFLFGALGLGMLDARLFERRSRPPIAGGSATAMAAPTATEASIEADRRGAALRLGMMIAVAIGLHNFSEGLAIGVSARAGALGLALTLIVGFAIHNATEGFGIVGPLGSVRPSWRWLLLVGLVGGGPTFIGTLVGFRITSVPLELAFFALAAGAILYVVGEIWGSAQKRLSVQLIMVGLVAGFLLGLFSDLVITAGGG
jgi:ZIP family zinc transporter